MHLSVLFYAAMTGINLHFKNYGLTAFSALVCFYRIVEFALEETDNC